MYKAVDRITPTYLTKIFENINSVHSYNLRNSEFNICVPRPYTETGKNSFLLSRGGPLGWSFELLYFSTWVSGKSFVKMK